MARPSGWASFADLSSSAAELTAPHATTTTSAENETSWNGWIGWGRYEQQGAVQDALWVCKPFNGQPASVGNGGMVALWAKGWREVEAFHATALAHGGSSEGAPGLRLSYNPDFYAAYVRDPDGNKLAVVCRGFTALQG